MNEDNIVIKQKGIIWYFFKSIFISTPNIKFLRNFLSFKNNFTVEF